MVESSENASKWTFELSHLFTHTAPGQGQEWKWAMLKSLTWYLKLYKTKIWHFSMPPKNHIMITWLFDFICQLFIQARMIRYIGNSICMNHTVSKLHCMSQCRIWWETWWHKTKTRHFSLTAYWAKVPSDVTSKGFKQALRVPFGFSNLVSLIANSFAFILS